VTISLEISEKPSGAFTTPYSAEAVTLPASVSLAALLGTRPTKLDVTLDDSSGSDMHSVWAALAPSALSDTKWLVLASALTWTTMSNGTGATMWGNTSRYTTSASWQTAPLDTSNYPAGKYRLLVRASQEAGTGYVMDSQNQTALPITRASQHIQVVGDVDLPVQDTAAGVASNLTLSVRSDGTNDCIVNAFVLLPLGLGYFSWHPATATVDVDQLDVGPTGIFVDGVTDYTDFQGGVLEPRTLAAHSGTLIATAEPTGSDFPADWDKTDAQCSADTGLFKCVAVAGSSWMWYAKTLAGTPRVVPDEWYELSCHQDVTAYTDGDVEIRVRWMDVDGNTVREDVVNAADGTPAETYPLVYMKAPVHAVYARVMLGAGVDATFTAYWENVVFRRCPLRLIMVAETVDGSLTSYLHPAALTVKYTPHYEVAR